MTWGDENIGVTFAIQKDSVNDDIKGLFQFVSSMIGEGGILVVFVYVFGFNLIRRVSGSLNKVTFVNDGGAKSRSVEGPDCKKTILGRGRDMEVGKNSGNSIGVKSGWKEPNGTGARGGKGGVVMKK